MRLVFTNNTNCHARFHPFSSQTQINGTAIGLNGHRPVAQVARSTLSMALHRTDCAAIPHLDYYEGSAIMVLSLRKPSRVTIVFSEEALL